MQLKAVLEECAHRLKKKKAMEKWLFKEMKINLLTGDVDAQ